MSNRDRFLDSHVDDYASSQSNGRSYSQSSGQSKFTPLRIAYLVIAILSIIVFALSIALGVANKKSDDPSPEGPSGLEGEIKLSSLMEQLTQIQNIADSNNGNRAVGTSGFNATVDYIESQLKKTNFAIFKQYFSIVDWSLDATPTMQIMVDEQSIKQTDRANSRLVNQFNDQFNELTDQQTFNYVYGQDYTIISYSGSIQSNNQPISFVPNNGCSESDYSSIGNTIGIVQYTNCTSISNRIKNATANGALGLIVYALSAGGGQLINTRAPDTNTLPAVFMTYAAGAPLALMAQADRSGTKTFSINLSIQQSRPEIVLTNICADTRVGDPTSTIIIGSHSDGVKAGSGINDNGSGTSGNLVWAAAVNKLIESGSYPAYRSRVRFCFWGGEELGLLGSKYYVANAANQTAVGERLIDIQLNFNYDMMASPNYLYGVLDAHSSVGVNETAIPGSRYLTDLFVTYLTNHSLPWTSKEFNGRSDYGSYLAVGIPAGGISAFIDRVKTTAEVDYYTSVLGAGKGGIAGVSTDPCYHQKCDRLSNINPDVFLGIAQAQAWVLEQVAYIEPNELRVKMGRPALETYQHSHYIPDAYAEVWE